MFLVPPDGQSDTETEALQENIHGKVITPSVEEPKKYYSQRSLAIKYGNIWQ